jgi:hypothetical protein
LCCENFAQNFSAIGKLMRPSTSNDEVLHKIPWLLTLWLDT